MSQFPVSRSKFKLYKFLALFKTGPVHFRATLFEPRDLMKRAMLLLKDETNDLLPGKIHRYLAAVLVFSSVGSITCRMDVGAGETGFIAQEYLTVPQVSLPFFSYKLV